MAAFDRISSGIRDLDAALDNIRLGDNVVLRVSDLDEFHRFLDPFVARCRKDGRKLVYVRFASHPPLVAEEAGVETGGLLRLRLPFRVPDNLGDGHDDEQLLPGDLSLPV